MREGAAEEGVGSRGEAALGTTALLRRGSRSLQRIWAARISATGLSPAQAAVLAALAELGKSGVRALARALATDPMNAKRLADQLESRGLVVSSTEAGDRRTRSLALTGSGRAAAAEIERLAAEQEVWLRRRLGDDSTFGLVDTLLRLEQAVADRRPHGPEAWDDRHRGRPFSSDPDPLVLDVAGNLPVGSALDLGSGAGRNALALARAGWSVTAVDFSPVALEQLQEAARERSLAVSTVQSDLLSFRHHGPPVDLCLVANVHLPDAELRDVLARARDALAPSGRLLLIGHHLDGLPGHGPSGAGLLLSEERVGRVLPAGLEVERLERHQRTRGGDLGEIEDLVLLLLARRGPA